MENGDFNARINSRSGSKQMVSRNPKEGVNYLNVAEYCKSIFANQFFINIKTISKLLLSMVKYDSRKTNVLLG